MKWYEKQKKLFEETVDKEQKEQDVTDTTPEIEKEDVPIIQEEVNEVKNIMYEPTVISEGTILQGDINVKGDLQIRGCVYGNISCDGHLELDGEVQGNIKVGKGTFSKAKVAGDIVCNSL